MATGRRRPPLTRKVKPGRSSTEAQTGLTVLERWRDRVKRAEKLREDWETEYEVKRCELYFLGKQAKSGSQPSGLVLNHFLSTVQTMLPNLFIAPPKFFVRPAPGRAANAPEQPSLIGEGILESISTQDDHFENAVNLALLQAFFRLGCLKVCYDPRLEPNPLAGEPMFAAGQIDQAGQPQPLVHPVSGQPLTEPTEVVTDEVYRWQWVDATKLLLPDEGPDESRWTWIGEEVIVSLDDAKDDTRFRPGLREQLETNVSRSARARERQARAWVSGDDEDGSLKYYECYDLRRKRLLIWADGQPFDEFLVDDDLPDGIEDHPYLLLRWLPIIQPEPLPWPYPYTRSWLDPQYEYNVRRKQIMEGAKRSSRKFLYFEGTFKDEAEMEKLTTNPDDMTFAMGTDPRLAPVAVDAPALHESIYRDIPLLMNDWRILTGQTGARLSSPSGDTATEASFVERAANLRDAKLQRAVLQWLTAAGRKMFQLVQQTLTLDLWISMRDLSDKEVQNLVQRAYGLPPEALQLIPGLKEIIRERFGQTKPLQVTRQQLMFEAQVSVAPGSSRPRNLDVERKQWMEFLQVLGAFPQLALSRELLRETASKFEFLSEKMLDELHALAMKMVEVNANQAGRNQGGQTDAAAQTNGAQGGPIPGEMSALMARILPGLMGGAG